MTSKESESECFVYITLPHATTGVTAGRFEITKDKLGNSTGKFIYGRTYLSRSDAVDIDPVELKLGEDLFRTARLEGVFSSLRDAGPDFWGRHVIERHSGKIALSEIDYLLESPDDRAGALGFGLNQKPPAPMRKYNKTIDLARLQQIADKLLREENVNTELESIQVRELLLLQTSMGGARPKAVVEDETGLWVAKFSRPDDRWNNPLVEHAMLVLARQCGINAAISRVENIGGKEVLLVQRFDRNKTSLGYVRARMISGLTLLRADESPLRRERWSYVLMAEELRRVVAEPKRDAAELFRRICFNSLISNIDDHPRNHALISFDKGWKLSPAYDLTPSLAVSQERRDLALECGNLGRYANAKNLLSQCSRFLLAEAEANQIISDMAAHVEANWHSVARSQGVSERDARTIKEAFNYPGFSL